MRRIWPKDVYSFCFHCSTKKNTTVVNFSTLFIQLRCLHSSNSIHSSIRVPFCLCVKTSLSAKPLIWLPPTGSFSCKSNSVSHGDSFWNWGTKKHSSMSCSQEPLIVRCYWVESCCSTAGRSVPDHQGNMKKKRNLSGWRLNSLTLSSHFYTEH